MKLWSSLLSYGIFRLFQTKSYQSLQTGRTQWQSVLAVIYENILMSSSSGNWLMCIPLWLRSSMASYLQLPSEWKSSSKSLDSIPFRFLSNDWIPETSKPSMICWVKLCKMTYNLKLTQHAQWTLNEIEKTLNWIFARWKSMHQELEIP